MSGETLHLVIEGCGVCDFCAIGDAQHKILCAPFKMDTMFGFEQWSDETWLACDPCYELVMAGEWERLIDRAIRLLPAEVEPLKYMPEYRELLRKWYGLLKINMGRVA